jgi:hypothetical protein
VCEPIVSVSYFTLTSSHTTDRVRLTFLVQIKKKKNVSATNVGLSRLGVVVVSVLATGPKVRGFKPGGGNGFFDKYPHHTFLRMGSNVRGPKS